MSSPGNSNCRQPVRESDAVKKVRTVLATGPESDRKVADVRSSDSISERLQTIQITEFRHSLHNPFSPINGLIDIIHPQGIELKIETERLPVGSVSYDSDGKPTFQRRFGVDFQGPRNMRELHLRRTTALDALRAICETFGLGYHFDGDSIIMVNPDNPRAVWACDSLTAETIAGLFAADNRAAVDRFQRGKVRITGAVTSLARNVAGHTIAVLYGERPVRVELTALDDETQVQALRDTFRQLEERERQREERERRRQEITRRYRSTTRSGQRPVRRISDDVPLAPSPPSGSAVVISVVAKYETQMGHVIVFTGGRDMTWQRVHRYSP